MSLAGSAVVAIWNGIRPEARQEFYEWHCREHMLERAAVPGFRRGRRLIAERGNPEWFTLYEVDTPEVLSSAPYLQRLNAPTDWTRRVVPSFTDVTRCLSRVVLSSGEGVGGMMATLRCDPAADRAGDLEHYLRHVTSILPSLPGVYGAHLCRLERDASTVQTEEKKSRAGDTLVAEFVLMVEACSFQPLEAVLSGDLARERLLEAGAAAEHPLETGIYRLEFVC